jgi:CheY-like chemotaxis protein
MAETTGFQLSLPYRANTNLEQISDWLTKILVGVGLTQLLNIPKTLQSLGSALAPALGNFTNSGLFVVAELVYFGICGFLASFLWTRVNLPKLYAQADLDSMLRKERAKSEAKGKEEGRKEEGLLALAADMWGPPKAPAPQLTGKTPEEPMAPKYILWVDDQPEKNSGESKILREKLGVEIDTAFSTREALNRIDRDPRKYSLVISDMRRPESFTAGYDLLEKLLKQGKKVPYIIYSSGTTPEKQLEAIRKGAKGRPIGPVELYQMVSDVLSQPS